MEALQGLGPDSPKSQRGWGGGGSGARLLHPHPPWRPQIPSSLEGREAARVPRLANLQMGLSGSNPDVRPSQYTHGL